MPYEHRPQYLIPFLKVNVVDLHGLTDCWSDIKKCAEQAGFDITLQNAIRVLSLDLSFTDIMPSQGFEFYSPLFGTLPLAKHVATLHQCTSTTDLTITLRFQWGEFALHDAMRPGQIQSFVLDKNGWLCVLSNLRKLKTVTLVGRVDPEETQTAF